MVILFQYESGRGGRHLSRSTRLLMWVLVRVWSWLPILIQQQHQESGEEDDRTQFWMGWLGGSLLEVFQVWSRQRSGQEAEI